ncbi:serine protease inhibitor [Plakobranchus ocellatus]|uniref:Serine protease inhibitor n=1 Tax=Plakobranchus ocellatus TaxID=259542 RepID=A0AAV3ZG39_9GAST|nr:serine protease inhibitor [Plakobranchus ocellatus]
MTGLRNRPWDRSSTSFLRTPLPTRRFSCWLTPSTSRATGQLPSDQRILTSDLSGDRFSLFILLLDKGVSLNSLETVLNAETLNTTLNTDVPLSNIMLEIPKFSLDTDEDMIERMQELGIQHLFDATRSSLTRMTSNPNAGVSQMKHRAVIAVAEGRTTASAATSMNIIFRSRPFELKVNRPFLFVLLDKTAHMNFFMGRYVNPQGDNVLE